MFSLFDKENNFLQFEKNEFMRKIFSKTFKPTKYDKVGR